MDFSAESKVYLTLSRPSRLPQKQQTAGIFRLYRPLIENRTLEELRFTALDFVKGMVNFLKFWCLTLNLCSPCGMELKCLGKIHAIADNRSLDRYTVEYGLKNGQLHVVICG